MPKYVADDYSAIAKGLKKLEQEKQASLSPSPLKSPSGYWWCDNCEDKLHPNSTTRHYETGIRTCDECEELVVPFNP